MDHETKRIYFNMTTERVTFELRSRPCVKKTIEARAALVELLKMCIEHQNFLHCDGELLEKASITHDGNKWVFRSEALVPKPVENL
jgi:hypothetical protein